MGDIHGLNRCACCPDEGQLQQPKGAPSECRKAAAEEALGKQARLLVNKLLHEDAPAIVEPMKMPRAILIINDGVTGELKLASTVPQTHIARALRAAADAFEMDFGDAAEP